MNKCSENVVKTGSGKLKTVTSRSKLFKNSTVCNGEIFLSLKFEEDYVSGYSSCTCPIPETPEFVVSCRKCGSVYMSMGLYEVESYLQEALLKGILL